MLEYQKFPIANARTGLDEALEPWLLPRDGYQAMVNCHLYRGVLEKIEGYSIYAYMTYRNQLKLTPAPDGVTTVFTGVITAPITSNFSGYGTLVLGSTSTTFSYASDTGGIVTLSSNQPGASGTINLTTLVVTLTFATAPPNSPYAAVYFLWDSAPPVMAGENAIMGIKQYFGANGSQEILIFDQKRVGKIVNNFGFAATQSETVQTVQEIPHDYVQTTVFTGDGVTLVFSGTLAAGHALPNTVSFVQYTSAGVLVSTIVDNGFGSLSGPNVNSAASFINYSTGAYQITFTVAPANGNTFTATVGVYGDLFTGSISNFFSLTNYQFKAFFTNSVDPIFYYDGSAIHYLNTNVSVKVVSASAGEPVYDVTTCLHVFTNRARLLLIAPTIFGVEEVFTIVWSRAGVPTDFTNDEDLPAPTSEPIRAIGYINTDLIVRFANSERVFRYTGDENSPFRWDTTNSLWACDAPYSTINYDTWFSSVGRPAIVASDGVNVRRADDSIPDFTDPSRLNEQTPIPFMSQESIQQGYGFRFDDLKEGWLCYNSSPQAEDGVTASDNVLAYSYLDNTYAVYSFPLSCLGFGRVINVPTWDTTFTTWDENLENWDSYQVQSNALLDLGGDQYGRVFELNSDNTQTNVAGETVPVLMSVITKNFNPFIEDGELCRFGYIDLFVTANQQSTLRVQFYVNDQLYIDANDQPAGYYKETKLTFNPKDAMSQNTNQSKVWKRIYVGSVAKEHTIRLYQNIEDFEDSIDQPIYIHAMVLYMKPAGRIFN